MSVITGLRSLFILAFAASCATQPLVSTPQLERFSQAVSDVQRQSTVTFDVYNKSMRSAQLDFAATQRKLVPDLFFEVFDQESAANWNSVLGILDEYVDAMRQISDPQLISAFRDNTSGLLMNINERAQRISGGKLWKSDTALTAGSGLAALAIKLGQSLMQAKANKSMAQALATTDPAVQDLIAGMRAVINSDQQTGLRATIDADMKNQLAATALAFDMARSAGEKRRVAADYVEILDLRDARLASLAGLDRSLKAIGDAHGAMTRGQSASVEAAIMNIRAEVQDTRELYAEIRTMLARRAAASSRGGD